MKDLDQRELDEAMKQVRGTWRPWLLLVLTLAVAGWGGWTLFERATAAEKIVAEVDERVAEKVARIAVLDQAKAELERRIESVDGENRALAELKARAEEDQKKAAVARARFEQLKAQVEQKTAQEIAAKLIEFDVGEKLEIRVADRALFDGAEPALSAAGQETLTSIGGVLTSTSGIALEIASHLDEGPTAWEASADRAAAIARFFEEKVRFPGAQITAIAYGASRPLAPNKTSAGRTKNRRVSLSLSLAD